MLDELDKNISILSESVARMVSRRKVVGTAVKGSFAAFAALTLGQVNGVKRALAAPVCVCDDNWTNGHPCSGCPGTSNCPSGCSVCTTNQWCGGWCDYSNGRWTSCTGLGNCGYGYKICTDCICPTCNNKCTCLSACTCCNCCKRGDVEAEMKRLASIGEFVPATA